MSINGYETPVLSNGRHQGRMISLPDAAQTACGQRRAKLLADTGYCNEADPEEQVFLKDYAYGKLRPIGSQFKRGSEAR